MNLKKFEALKDINCYKYFVTTYIEQNKCILDSTQFKVTKFLTLICNIYFKYSTKLLEIKQI